MNQAKGILVDIGSNDLLALNYKVGRIEGIKCAGGVCRLRMRSFLRSVETS